MKDALHNKKVKNIMDKNEMKKQRCFLEGFRRVIEF